MTSYSEDRRLDEKPVSGLISDALSQFSRLMRNEFALARAELVDKGQIAARGIAMIAIGAVLAIPSITLLLISLATLMMEMGMRPSVSYLLSGVLALVLGGILAWSGMANLKGNKLVPKRTIGQFQQDVATAKEHI